MKSWFKERIAVLTPVSRLFVFTLVLVSAIHNAAAAYQETAEIWPAKTVLKLHQPAVVRAEPPAISQLAPIAQSVSPDIEPLKIPNASLEPVSWTELDGWAGDDHARAFATFQASCRPIVRSNLVSDSRPIRAALQSVCARAVAVRKLDKTVARAFFEANFRPVRIRKLGEPAGFLTGYYEPVVDGSRFPTREFSVPLYRRPPDLIAAGATRPGGPFPNRGPAFRRTPNGQLVPYYDRSEIEHGALDGQHLEICWLRSGSDALSIEIEGSARIRLEDGTVLRVNYDAHSGSSDAIGRFVNEDSLVTHHVNIRKGMQAGLNKTKEVRQQSRPVVFFRIVALDDDTETRGAQGIPLSAGRSIAVDRTIHVYGTPFFIEADLPPADRQVPRTFRRIMIAQDTGSAIIGPARADLYFGFGDEAGRIAGRIRQEGRFTMLVPREIDPVAAGARLPLPHPKPLSTARVIARRLPSTRPSFIQLRRTWYGTSP